MPNKTDHPPRPDPPGVEDGIFGLYVALSHAHDELREQAASLARLEVTVQRLATEDKDILQMMRGDNNGERGFVARLMRLEGKVDGLLGKLDKLDGMMTARGLEVEKGRWGLAQTALVAMFSLLAAVVTAIITTMLRGGKP